VATAREKADDIKDKAQSKFENAKAKAKSDINDLNHSVQNS